MMHFISVLSSDISSDPVVCHSWIVPGFVSDSRGVFRTNAGQRSGKPQGMRRQMRRLFIRTAAPGVASGRSTRSTGSDRSGRGGTKERTGCSGRSRQFMAFSVFSFSSSFSVEEIYFFLFLFLFLYIYGCVCVAYFKGFVCKYLFFSMFWSLL